MALSDSDWADVLRHLRMRMQEAGFGDVDDLVMGDFRSMGRPALDVHRYLERVIHAMSERSQFGYRRALRALRENVRVEGGGEVEGIDLVFSEHDATLYGMRTSDLSDVDNFDPLIEQLKALLSSVAQARDSE